MMGSTETFSHRLWATIPGACCLGHTFTLGATVCMRACRQADEGVGLNAKLEMFLSRASCASCASRVLLVLLVLAFFLRTTEPATGGIPAL